MSCAVGDNGVRGGRRNTYTRPARTTRNTSFECPVVMRSTVSGAPGEKPCVSIHEASVTASTRGGEGMESQFFMIRSAAQLRRTIDREERARETNQGENE